MTSFFSKAKNKVASLLGGNNNSNNSNSSNKIGETTGGASTPSRQHSTTAFESHQNSTTDFSTSSQLASPSKLAELDKVLKGPLVDLQALRNICWCGVPDASKRYEAWCLMLRYMPNQTTMITNVLLRKRNEYAMYVQNHHKNVAWDEMLASQSTHGTAHNLQNVVLSNGSTTSDYASHEDLSIMRQIRKDVPRTFSGVHMLQHPRCQLLLERVLFIWAIRHPASSYVQGFNDILLPFLFVVLSKKISSDGDVYRLIHLPEATVKAVSGSLNESDWMEVEADSYWLLSAFMSSVQSNFTFSQGGTHALVQKLERIVSVADPTLYSFLKETAGVNFEEFAFRWMNCFLLRELAPHLGVRLFDTYCAEEVDSTTSLSISSTTSSSSSSSSIIDSSLSSVSKIGIASTNSANRLIGFAAFHVYVCASLLLRFSERIRQSNEFGEVLRLLQNPIPHVTNAEGQQVTVYTEETIGEITAQAFVLHQQYGSRIG